MRKLLFIAVLALGATAWAQMASHSSFNNDRSVGNDWYNQTLAPHVDHFISINESVDPFKTEPLQAAANASPLGGEQPASMAASIGQRGGDWYNQVVQSQAQLQSRELLAIRNSPGFEKRDKAQTE